MPAFRGAWQFRWRPGAGRLMQALTDLADAGVVLPLVVLAAAIFWACRWGAGLRAWCGATAGSFAAVGLLKIWLIGCGDGGFSASGHTVSGALVYGGLAALFVRRYLGTWLAWGLCCGGFAVLAGASRLAVHVHTPAEVLAGAAIGMAGGAALLYLAGPPPPAVAPQRVVWAALLIMLVLHGTRLPVEARLRDVSAWLHHSSCPVRGQCVPSACHA